LRNLSIPFLSSNDAILESIFRISLGTFIFEIYVISLAGDFKSEELGDFNS
jgi:hypothetical protein